MKAITLLYHDVVPEDRTDSSGFPVGTAALYKLTPESFAEHLNVVAGYLKTPVIGAPELAHYRRNEPPVMFTFDDGGVSFVEIGEMLAAHDWRGHFFITTDYIGTPGFLTEAQIRKMHRDGHVIGSHSCSHPRRMSHCDPAQMEREWAESARVLAGIIGEPVTTASVPGGFYSPEVARYAAKAGIRYLFSSDPTIHIKVVNGCAIIGRYCAKRYTPARWAGERVRRAPVTMLTETAIWNGKKLAKAIGGDALLALRRRILNGSS